MEASLLWGSLAVGLAGWVCALLLTGARHGEERSRASEVPWLFVGFAIALPILLFLVTLPSHAPFSQGQGLGRGFLIGAAGSLLAFWLESRSRALCGSGIESALLTAGPLFLAAACAAGALLWLPSVAIDALVSLAIGWLATSMILDAGQSQVANRPNHSAVYAVTLSGATALGVYRGSGTIEHFRWAASAVVLGAAVPLVIVVASLPGRIFGWLALKLPGASAIGRMLGGVAGDDAARDMVARLWQIVLAGGLAALAAWGLGAKALAQGGVIRSAGVGIVMGILVWWLVRDSDAATLGPGDAGTIGRGDPPSRRAGPSLSPGLALAALVVITGFMAAFRYLQGFGVGLALLAAWPVVGLGVVDKTHRAYETDQGQPEVATPDRALLGLMSLGAILVLFRLFQTRFSHELRGVTLTDDYALVGVLVGALLPAMLAGFQSRTAGPPWLALVRLAIAGALLLAVPAAVVLLWGAKCAMALVVGLALAAAGDWHLPTAARRYSSSLTQMFALAGALAVTQWLRHALPLASMARAQKVGAVGWTVAALIVLILLADYAGKFVAARRTGAAPAGAAK